MYYIMDMPFPSQEDAPDFGTIKMYFAGLPQTGYIEQATNRRLRAYTLLEKDLDKLDLISNAADGSQASVVDANETYILCDGEWIKWDVGTGSGGDTTIINMKWKHL